MVVFGEDLANAVGHDPVVDRLNIALKEQAFARKAHAIVVFASSVGSATEVGLLSQHPSLCQKTVIAIHTRHAGGFMATGASRVAAAQGARVVMYGDVDLRSCSLLDGLCDEVWRLYEGVVLRELARNPTRLG